MNCPSCGSPIEGNAAACGACGNALPKATLAPTETTQRGYGTATQSFDCKGCGAQTVYSATQMTLECPYCGSQQVVQLPADQQKDTVQPEAVVPFKVEKAKSLELFRGWVGSLWFAPGDLTQRAATGHVRGVYLPFWAYDVQTRTFYRGEHGHDRTESHQTTGPDGKPRTESRTVTDWKSGWGWSHGTHKDVLVCASKGIERGLVVAIEPWPMAERQPYTPAFLAGWEAERYAIGSDDAWRDHGVERVRTAEQATCEAKLRSEYKADKVRGVSVDVRYEGLRSRHLLLPAYISAYEYGGKTFRFMINGATGEVQGERPYSAGKIVLAVLVGLLLLAGLIGGVAALGRRNGPPQHVEQPIPPG